MVVRVTQLPQLPSTNGRPLTADYNPLVFTEMSKLDGDEVLWGQQSGRVYFWRKPKKRNGPFLTARVMAPFLTKPEPKYHGYLTMKAWAVPIKERDFWEVVGDPDNEGKYPSVLHPAFKDDLDYFSMVVRKRKRKKLLTRGYVREQLRQRGYELR